MNGKSHWELVYETKTPESVSWYAPHLQDSLRYVTRAASSLAATIMDVGGGESTLVDDLLEAGYINITVLDISARALEVTRRRLGAKGDLVKSLVADILEVDLPRAEFDIWHDRAVFHFLTSEEQRQRYVAQVLKALKPGGYAIVGTFGPEGPQKCSGLDVARYAPGGLHGVFVQPFHLLDSSTEIHTTPWGTSQQFVYCYCRRDSTFEQSARQLSLRDHRRQRLLRLVRQR